MGCSPVAAIICLRKQKEERDNFISTSKSVKDDKQLALEQQQAILDDLEEYERLNDIYKKIDWENI